MSWRKLNLALALTAGAVMSLSSVASANLLLNPGFEVAPDNPGPFNEVADNWDQFSFTSTGTHDGTMPHSGSFGISFSGGSATSGSTGAFQRVLGVTAGQEYDFSVWAKAGALPISTDDTNGGAAIRVEWHANADGTSSKISEDLLPIGALLSTQYQQFSVQAFAPAGANHARAVMLHRHNDQTVYYDDASFVAVPEPASAALLGLGGLALLRRR